MCLTSTITIAFAQKKKKKTGNEEQSTAVATVDYKEIGSPMPNIRLVTKKMEVVTDKDLKHDGPTFVMVFNPTCDHCIQTTQILKRNAGLFKNTKVLLMATPNQIDNLQYFEDITEYPKYPLLQVGVDSAGYIDRTFNYASIPQINIYDKKHKLIRTFNGEPKIDSLKLYIE